SEGYEGKRCEHKEERLAVEAVKEQRRRKECRGANGEACTTPVVRVRDHQFMEASERSPQKNEVERQAHPNHRDSARHLGTEREEWKERPHRRAEIPLARNAQVVLTVVLRR